MAQPKPHILAVLSGPDSNVCFSNLTHFHLCHQIQVVFNEGGMGPMGHCRHSICRSELLANSSHGLGKQGQGIYEYKCCGKNADMNALCSIIMPKVSTSLKLD